MHCKNDMGEIKMKLDFKKFNTGTLFLVRTPEVFPEGYAEKCFADMKNNLHFDFATLLETWNCMDGTVWKSDDFPRSSFWKNEERDPLEECFAAADKYGMAFLPEAGMMDDDFMYKHKDAMCTDFEGNLSRYGRIGLVPTYPETLKYLKRKYDALLQKFGHHPSCCGVCLPCENSIIVTYDPYTKAAYKEKFNEEMPSPDVIFADKAIENKVFRFLEDTFLAMYRALASYIKEKYNLPLMHYPIDVISSASFMQPERVYPERNIAVMTQAKELDLLNMQLHPPLYPNPYFFKLETEYLMANANGIPCMADTHFYHEMAAGRVPDMTPKRIVDSILSTLTPNGISFFCYGFMAEELPGWKKELNPNAPVYRVYSEENTTKARRKMALNAMRYVEQLRNFMENTKHTADCAIYFPEELNADYLYSSYASEHIFGLHEMLNAASVPVAVTAKIPEKSTEIKALIMDSVQTISDEDAQKLESYIETGGKLIVVGKCCARIEQIAGINVKQSEALVAVSPQSKNYNHCLFRLPRDGKHYTEENGTPLLLYNNGEAAVTKKGNVIFFGAADAVGRFSLYRDYSLVEYWKNLLMQENLNSGVHFGNEYVGRTNGHQFTSCDLYKNDEKCLLFIRNFGVEHYHASVKWKLPENMRVVKALADGEEFQFEQGEEMPVFEHFVAIYAERKR